MAQSDIPQSAQRWHDWFKREEKKTKLSYLAKPSTLISRIRSETAIAKDYQGREIWELIQNAHDQAVLGGVQTDVVIDLSQGGMIIANHGQAFTTAGIQCLENLHFSKKIDYTQSLIGSKGLGFKSLLNLSDAPIILSGALDVIYCKEHANQETWKLAEESLELSQLLNQEKRLNPDYIAPIFSFPNYQRNRFDEKSMKRPFKHLDFYLSCKKWLNRNFSTVIGLPFQSVATYKFALASLKQFQPANLLFLPYIKSIKVIIENSQSLTYTHQVIDQQNKIYVNNKLSQTWVKFSKYHKKKSMTDNSKARANISLAFPKCVGAQKACFAQTLYAFFPTKENFPFNMLCHIDATLDQSRNRILNTPCNQNLIRDLIIFMVHCCEELTRLQHFCRYTIYRFLVPVGKTSLELQQSSFEKVLFDKAAKAAIIPNIAGQLKPASKLHRIKHANLSWLPIKAFGDISFAKTLADSAFFKKLGIQELDIKQVSARLLQLPTLPSYHRVLLIKGLLQYNWPSHCHHASLLSHEILEASQSPRYIFNQPKHFNTNNKISWYKLYFLNPNLERHLMKALSCSSHTVLESKIHSLGFRHFSLGRALMDLSYSLKQQKLKLLNHIEESKSRGQIAKLNLEALNMAFNIYKCHVEKAGRDDRPSEFVFPLLNIKGEFIPSNQLYFNKTIDIKAKIVHELYIHWAPEKVLCPLHKLKLPINDKNLLKGFLNYLGVAQWPRLLSTSSTEPQFIKSLIYQIPMPCDIQDYIVRHPQDLEQSEIRVQVQTLDGLSKILSNAPYSSICAWVVADPRFLDWSKKDRKHTKLSFRKQADRNFRSYNKPLSSYIHWYLINQKWMIDTKLVYQAPKNCILSSSGIDSFFPKPSTPPPSILKKFNLEKKHLLQSWIISGVIQSLSSEPLDSLYKRLLELPKLAVSNETLNHQALSLYQAVLAKRPVHQDRHSSYAQLFFKLGFMLGRYHGKSHFFPLRELLYLNSVSIPAHLLSQLKLVTLPQQIDPTLVKAAFNIESLYQSQIKQKLLKTEEAPCLNLWFQEIKPYVLELATHQANCRRKIKLISQLSLKLCTYIDTQISFQGKIFSHKLKKWDWFSANNMLYVNVESPTEATAKNELLIDTISTALINILKKGNISDYSKLLMCKSERRKQILERMIGIDYVQINPRNKNINSDFEPPETNEHDLCLSPTYLPPSDLSIMDNMDHMDKEKSKNTELSAISFEPKGGQSKANKQTQNEGKLALSKSYFNSKPARSKLRLSLSSIPPQQSIGVSVAKINSGYEIEKKVLEIESLFEPARFPVYVGHIRGTQGLGCDVVSFKTEHDALDFQEGRNNNLDQVVRFIEVKYRSNNKMEIELRGNELTCAQKFSERYYLYYLTEITDKSWRLHILHNPMLHKKSLEPSIHIHLNKAASLMTYDIESR